MYSTLQAALGTWPSDSSHNANAEPNSAQPSGLNERITFGSEDDRRSASSTFVVRAEAFPKEKVFIPPYFVPPGRITQDPGTQDVVEKLREALQQDAAATARTGDRPYAGHVDNIDPAIQGLKPLAPKHLESSRPRVSKEPRRDLQLDQIPDAPSPTPDTKDIQFRRGINWPTSARQAFHAMINAPGYVNRYRLTPAKYQRIVTYLRNPDVEPTNADGSKDHQTKYQAANWVLRDGRLYRKAESKGGRGGVGLRRHLDVDEVWDVLTAEHLRSEHLGRDRLRKALEKRFIGYTLQEIMFVLRECRHCNKKTNDSGDPKIDRPGSPNGVQSGEVDVSSDLQERRAVGSDSAAAIDNLPRKQTSNFMWF